MTRFSEALELLKDVGLLIQSSDGMPTFIEFSILVYILTQLVEVTGPLTAEDSVNITDVQEEDAFEVAVVRHSHDGNQCGHKVIYSGGFELNGELVDHEYAPEGLWNDEPEQEFE